jgi:hypothetical protein
MNWTPKEILKPLALALVGIFYAMVNRSSDSQRNATWTFDRYDTHQIPFGFKAELRLILKFDENGTPVPHRRAGDIETP